MPFKSKAQARAMFASNPRLAKKMEDATDALGKGGIKGLPDHTKLLAGAKGHHKKHTRGH